MVQLVPEPLPALSTDSHDQELDITQDEVTTQGTENTHDAEQEAANTDQEILAQGEEKCAHKTWCLNSYSILKFWIVITFHFIFKTRNTQILVCCICDIYKSIQWTCMSIHSLNVWYDNPNEASLKLFTSKCLSWSAEEPSRPPPRRALKKLLDRIRNQRSQWTGAWSHAPAPSSPTAFTDQIPERDTTIETGSLTSEEKDKQPPAELPEPQGQFSKVY